MDDDFHNEGIMLSVDNGTIHRNSILEGVTIPSENRLAYAADEILRVLGDPRDHADVKSAIGPGIMGWPRLLQG